jgi:hypothetical protein
MIDYQRFADEFFSSVEKGESLYAILDGARSSEIAPALHNLEVARESLFKGRSEEPLWDVAPYLIRCERDSVFLRWVVERGWGKSWGIFFISRAGLEQLLEHFQRFLLVELEDGKKVYFRFYDPRVLPVFLPTCTPEEVKSFFGPVRNFFVDAAGAGLFLKLGLGPAGVTQVKGSFSSSKQNQIGDSMP